MPLRLAVKDIAFFERPLPFVRPFRFGAVTINAATQVFVRVEIEVEGKGRATGVGEVRFRGAITPDVSCVRYEVDMRQVKRGRLVLGIADGRVLANDSCVYEARDMKVALVGAAG